MRSLLIAALVCVPFAAYAQAPKQVEVTNLPALQEVTGTVEVTNDTANPVEVTGDVTVTNCPTPTGTARYQLVGFTASTFLGDTGVLGFAAACQSEFSNADMRMCTSEEVMSTTAIPSGLGGQAWVRPVVVGGGDATSFVDASSLGGSASQLSCRAWRVTDASGLTVFANGTFTLNGCSNAQPVSCCAPIP